jgi:putative flippase GtrA
VEARRLARFAAVGGLGFAVDGGLLALLFHGLGVDPHGARAVSFTCAVTVTWWLNRRLTFRDRRAEGAGERREYLRYIGVQILGALANLAVYSALLATTAFFAAQPVGALAVGAVAGLAVNYSLSLLVVFQERT